MPSSIMGHRNFSPFGHGSLDTSSFFSEELFATERQVGFWKSESVPDDLGMEGKSLLTGSKSVSSSPLNNKLHRMEGTVRGIEVSQPHHGDQKVDLSFDHQIMESERMKSIFAAPWGISEHVADFGSESWNQPDSSLLRGNHVKSSKAQYENGIFPSILPDALRKKLIISSKSVALGQFTDKLNSNIEEEEPSESMEEIEALTIGNLLPDDDELLSGVVDDIGDICRPTNRDDIDDDIFYSSGGMELEADNIVNDITASKLTGEGSFNSLRGGLDGTYAAKHPSRTLFVRNVNSNVEDTELRTLFEQYGDICALYTACKHRGFVMISYYDIRSACNAMLALQNKPLSLHKLDIHFSTPKDNSSDKDIDQDTLVVFDLDSSVSDEDLHQIFGIYGEIKEIHETSHELQQKLIEFYDVRAVDAALRALHRSDIAGKKIKLESSRYESSRWCLRKHASAEMEQGEPNKSKAEGHNSSPSGQSGSLPLGALTMNNLERGGIQIVKSAVRASVSPFIENTFHGISSSIPEHLSSPIGIASVGNLNNHAVPGDLSHSSGQMNFGFQGMPRFHPHSLPEYHNGVTNGIPYASSISRHAEGIDNRNLHKLKSGVLSSSFDPNEVFGVSNNGNFPLRSHQYAFNNTNVYHHQLAGPVVWSNSLPYMSTASGHPPPQMHGLPRSPMHMLKTVMPSHHIGSAPAVNHTVWDRRHTCTGDAAESLAFHPASLGTIGLTGSPQFHQLELASRGIFPHTGGICMEPSLSPAHVGIHSPQLRCQIMNNRNHMIPMSASLDGPNDRIRSRRNDTSVNQADNKKQYELDIESIVRGEESRTTLMIKNIPNKYTSKMLLAAIDENHKGTYDFIYLPIDFKNKCNVGYAFINMTDPQHIIPFYKSFNGKKWEKFNSEKVASLAYARIQGKTSLVAHFQNSSLMNEDKRCRPILFHSDGPNAGDQEPFPMGMNIRSRSGRSRAASSSDEQQGASPCALPNGESSTEAAGSPNSIKD